MTEPTEPSLPPRVPVGQAKGPFVHLGSGNWVNAYHVVAIEPSISASSVCNVILDVPDADANGPFMQVGNLDASGMLNAVVGALVTWERTKGREREWGVVDASEEIEEAREGDGANGSQTNDE